MLHRILALVLLAGCSLAVVRTHSAPALSNRQQEAAPQKLVFADDCLIETLNRVIQERFVKGDGFGAQRIIGPPYHLQRFLPENAEEQAAVTRLEKEGLTVGFYLAGRKLLGPKPDSAQLALLGKASFGRPIHGPVAVTANAHRAQMPRSESLWEQGQEAMLAFSKSQRHDFSAGQWNFIALPVRAQQSCLKCHNHTALDYLAHDPKNRKELKVGDPLGVLIYTYLREH